jgi:hypothetical protein
VQCANEKRRVKYQTDPIWHEEIRESGNLWHREAYKKNPEKYNARTKKRMTNEENRQKRTEYNKRRRKELRKTIIDHYSKGENRCGCCGENHFEFLQLDHIEGNGEKHRKEIKRSAGEAFYTWLIRNNFPEGYRVLCSNCNQSLGMYGYCPHEGRTASR